MGTDIDYRQASLAVWNAIGVLRSLPTRSPAAEQALADLETLYLKLIDEAKRRDAAAASDRK